MGCWNATCLLSGLSITSRDRVVLFPFSDSGSKLCAIPFRGKYNDYGFIENVDDNPLHDLFIDSVNKMTIQKSEIKSYVNDSEYESVKEKRINELESKEKLTDDEQKEYVLLLYDNCNKPVVITKTNNDKYTLDTFLDELSNGIKYYYPFSNTFRPISFAFVLERVWDEMCALFNTSDVYEHILYGKTPIDVVNELKKLILTDYRLNSISLDMKYVIKTTNRMLYSTYLDDCTNIFHADVSIISNEKVFNEYMKLYLDKYLLKTITTCMRKSIECEPYIGSQINNRILMNKVYSIFSNILKEDSNESINS